ncbi:MAG: hypothetical protein K2W85_15225 [Phycisphaerales bacterium]|nr:hypothetical protein [Phycisphaerales bacterium]
MRTSALLAVVGLAVAASAASADVIARIEVIANNALTNQEIGRGVWTAPVDPSLPGGGLSWGTLTGENDAAIDIGGGTKVHGIDFGWIWDPIVTANFNVSSGPVNTTFTVNSAFLSFPTIPGAVAKASAFIGVTDSATFGDIGSVTLSGLQAGGNAFSARYNNNTQTFVNLISGGTVGVGPGGSAAFTGQNAAFPFYETIPVAADDMQSQFRFSLSRFDRASGTSFFEIVPAPGTAAVLGLGGLLAARRRRA